MMKAVSYVRQSKERKDRDSISPKTQEEKMEQYAVFENDEIVKVFQDIDVSGFRIHYSKRTGLKELFEYIEKNDIKKVYVYALSRLSRRIKEFIEIVEMLEEKGISVVSVTEKTDMSTPQGRLFRNILLSFNEYYSDSLSSTIIDNHKKNVQLGKWNGGNVPYGFDWIKQDMKFIKNDDFKYLQLIIDKAINGWGVKKISNYLNKRKIKSPAGKTWNSQSIKYILSNKFYRGNLNYDGESYNSELVDKIITDNQWELIQLNLSRYEGLGPKTKITPHLLTGILKCSHCDSRFEIRYNGSTKARRYICSGRQYSQGNKCTSLLIDADSLEERILEHIHTLVKSSYFDEIIEEYTNTSKPIEKDITEEIKRLESELFKIVQAQEEIYEETFINKAIKKERFYEMNNKFDKQRESLEEEIKILYREKETTDTTFIMDYKETLNNFTEIFSELNKDEQRAAIHDLIEKIKVHDDHVKLYLPFSDSKIKSTSIKRGTMYF